MQEINQTTSTRNQSTIENKIGKALCIFDNTYDSANITSTTLLDVKVGNLVVRTATGVALATTANLENIIGVSVENVTIPANGTLKLNYTTGGTINENLLALPSTITLSSLVKEGGKNVKDQLNSIGFSLKAVFDNSK